MRSRGGCNLRFFLNSVRYAEGIDLEVHTVAVETLKKLVDKILVSVPFERILQARKLKIVGISTPKQTQTTQIWKVQLKVDQHALPFNTKFHCIKSTQICFLGLTQLEHHQSRWLVRKKPCLTFSILNRQRANYSTRFQRLKFQTTLTGTK